MVDSTRWTSTAQQDLLNLLPAAPAGDQVQIKREALTEATTLWGKNKYSHLNTFDLCALNKYWRTPFFLLYLGDSNYGVKLQQMDHIDQYYRPSEHFREEVYGCTTAFMENGCKDSAFMNQWTVATFSKCKSIAIIDVKPVSYPFSRTTMYGGLRNWPPLFLTFFFCPFSVLFL